MAAAICVGPACSWSHACCLGRIAIACHPTGGHSLRGRRARGIGVGVGELKGGGQTGAETIPHLLRIHHMEEKLVPKRRRAIPPHLPAPLRLRVSEQLVGNRPRSPDVLRSTGKKGPPDGLAHEATLAPITHTHTRTGAKKGDAISVLAPRATLDRARLAPSAKAASTATFLAAFAERLRALKTLDGAYPDWTRLEGEERAVCLPASTSKARFGMSQTGPQLRRTAFGRAAALVSTSSDVFVCSWPREREHGASEWIATAAAWGLRLIRSHYLYSVSSCGVATFCHFLAIMN